MAEIIKVLKIPHNQSAIMITLSPIVRNQVEGGLLSPKQKTRYKPKIKKGCKQLKSYLKYKVRRIYL